MRKGKRQSAYLAVLFGKEPGKKTPGQGGPGVQKI